MEWPGETQGKALGVRSGLGATLPLCAGSAAQEPLDNFGAGTDGETIAILQPHFFMEVQVLF